MTGWVEIHWKYTPDGFCRRKDSGQDVFVRTPSKDTMISSPAVAHFISNVTCDECKKYHTLHPERVNAGDIV